MTNRHAPAQEGATDFDHTDAVVSEQRPGPDDLTAPIGVSPPIASQAGPSSADPAPAGLAEATPPRGGARGVAVLPGLVVRTRRSDHQLQGETVYRVGRDPKSDIVMTDSRVSWRHGVLRIDGDAWIFEDLGSTNGTFLGPERLDRVEISADRVVRLGNPDDGPFLRCMPQAPAVAAGQDAAPAAGRPGTALAAPPAPPRRPRPPRKSTRGAMPRRGAMPSPGGSRLRRPGPCRLPSASRPGRPLRRVSPP